MCNVCVLPCGCGGEGGGGRQRSAQENEKITDTLQGSVDKSYLFCFGGEGSLDFLVFSHNKHMLVL